MDEVKQSPKGWAVCTFDDLLAYIQPSKYIVESTEYSDSYKTPVLTPGKTFILGYTNERHGIFDQLPSIIFDDFTTASKYVNFPFKVKSSAMKILVPSSELVNLKLIDYCMQSIKIRSDTHKRYWISVYAKKPLCIPPLNEQHRIVAKIEELFSELEKGVESLKAAKAQLAVYRQSVLKTAFEGRLTESWRAEHAAELESAEDLVARTPCPPRPNRWNTRSKEIIKGHVALAVGNPQTPLPDGWIWCALVDVARMESGHTPSRSHLEWWNGDIPWIGIADAKAHTGSTIHETIQHTNKDGLANSAARLLPGGTVCISRTASVGYVVVMGRDMATSQDFVNWVPTEAVTSDWLRFIFGADREYLRRFGKGTVHKTIYFPEWLSVYIALPPLEEQHQIVQEIESRFSVVEKMEQTIDESLQKAEALRQSILKRAFEGKLVPQDPADEPASELLARIRAERETAMSAKKKREAA